MKLKSNEIAHQIAQFPCSTLKKYSDSRTPSSAKSVQWTAFLTLSRPNFALIVPFRSVVAI